MNQPADTAAVWSQKAHPRFERAASPDSPLRIGFFTDTYAPQVNGVAVSLGLLVQQMRALGHQVEVFAPKFPDYCDAEPGIHRLPAVRYMQMPPFYIAAPAAPRAALALRRTRFDIIHTHSPLSLGGLAYLSAHLKHVPLVYTYHTSLCDYTHYIKLIGETRAAVRAAGWFSTFTCNRADHIVTPSAKFERLLREQHVRPPIHVIPNGIDLDPFRAPQAPGSWRRRLGLDSNAPLLLYVGRLAPEKRIDFLIEAFSRIACHYPDARFVLAGDGSARPALEKQAAASRAADRIHFLGMVERRDLPDLLHDTDLFLSASTSEVHPLSMIEALASGLPVVAVHDEALKEMVIEGENGRLTPRELEPFVGAAQSLLADPTGRRAWGQASRKLSEKYSIEAQVAVLTRLYRESIDQKRN